MGCCKACLIVSCVIVSLVFAVGVIAGVGYGIAVAVMRANGSTQPGTNFGMGFQQCCSSTANQLNLSHGWTDRCLNLVDSFQVAFDTSNYDMVLLALGMQNAEYANALFWSTNGVKRVSTIAMSIASISPPSSFNIRAGKFTPSTHNRNAGITLPLSGLPFTVDHLEIAQSSTRDHYDSIVQYRDQAPPLQAPAITPRLVASIDFT